MQLDIIGTAIALAIVELIAVSFFVSIEGMNYIGVFIVLGAFNALCLKVGASK